jgi:eukaryotic-like serine/threonine-protein kinase
VKILDFGIAKVAELASKSRNTVNIGTPLYMAPEQIEGSRLGPEADRFSLGHVAFELLTGESYWEPELRRCPNSLALLKVIEGPRPELASVRAARLGVTVGPDFDAWFERATAREPGARHQSAGALVSELQIALGESAVAAHPLPPIPVARASLPSVAEDPTLRGLASSPGSRTSASERVTEPRSAPLVQPAPAARRWPLFLAAGALGLIGGGLALALVIGASSTADEPLEPGEEASTTLAPPPLAGQPTPSASGARPEASSSGSAPSTSAGRPSPRPGSTSTSKASEKRALCRLHPERCM